MDNGKGEKVINSNSSNAGLNLVKRKLELYDKLTKTKRNSFYNISYFKDQGTVSRIIIYNPIKSDE